MLVDDRLFESIKKEWILVVEWFKECKGGELGWWVGIKNRGKCLFLSKL